MFVPTQDMWLVRKAAQPRAIAVRAKLHTPAYEKWMRLYAQAHPWLSEWLYSYPRSLPDHARDIFRVDHLAKMEAFRKEATISAIAEATERPTTARKLTRNPRYGSHVSHQLIGCWLEMHAEHDWFKRWLLRGANLPSEVAVASPAQLCYSRFAWDWVGHCIRAKIDPNSSYCHWFADPQMIPDIRWLRWLFGLPEPDGFFIVPLKLQELRRERTLGSIC